VEEAECLKHEANFLLANGGLPVSANWFTATSSTNTDPSSGDNKQPSIDSKRCLPAPRRTHDQGKSSTLEYQ